MVFKKVTNLGELVMFSHTLFSLPFGLTSMVLASGGMPKLSIFFWILLALVSARTGANALNRVIDKDIDKKNPRTAGRHIPTGKVGVFEAWALTIGSFVLMAVSAFMLNITCLVLLPVAIAIFFVYSYSKRFTYFCHLILGMACGGAPMGAWLAVTGKPSFTAFLLAAIVTCWVAGFDIIYAIQDIEFDTKEGLYSVPRRFGRKGAHIISALLHAAVVFMLGVLYFVLKLHYVYLIGVAIICSLLLIEHIIIAPRNDRLLIKNKYIIASYTINQIISIVFIVFTLGDYFLWKM